jgi:hypothetical protein
MPLVCVGMGDAIPGQGKRSRWTSEEVELLRNLWGTQRDGEIADRLGKTVKAIRSKATEMNIRAEKGRRTVCRSGRIAFPWTSDEDLVLIKNVGHLSIFELLDLLPRRNRLAIERRCYELGFSPTQGTSTRLQIERETGYDWRQIQRARDALGQTWKRYGVRKYMITFDQVQDIVEYLKNETRKWSLHYGLDCCRVCGASGDEERTRHSGDGLCKRCWDFRRHGRSQVVDALKKGKMMILTEEIWHAYIRDEPALEQPVEQAVVSPMAAAG